MATTSRSHSHAGDWLAFREPQFERPRPSDPGADEDVPSERESEEGRESDRREPDERPRDLAETP
jgi:hypothetical protein